MEETDEDEDEDEEASMPVKDDDDEDDDDKFGPVYDGNTVSKLEVMGETSVPLQDIV